jgi:hypothetical protein
MAKTGKDRLHIDLVTSVGADEQVEVARLLSLGATSIDIGQRDPDRVALADPD